MKKKIAATNDAAKAAKPTPTQQPTAYKIPMSLGFLVLSIGIGLIVPFFMGRVARNWLDAQQQRPTSTITTAHGSLPPPVLGAAQVLPPSTRYTTKHYEAKGSGSESFLVRSAPVNKSDNDTTQSSTPSSSRMYSTLNYQFHSETQIVDLLNQLVATSTDTILSYHCHREEEESISCVGIAPHGHIVLHAMKEGALLSVHGIQLDDTILDSPLIRSKEPTAAPTKPATRKSNTKAKTASAFIHPALFLRENVSTAVLVGGSAASLEQILLHSDVIDSLILLEKDDSISDCANCEIMEESAKDWFAKRGNESIDLIYVESMIPDEEVISHISRSLNQTGLLVVQSQSMDSKWQWIESLSDGVEEYEVIKDYQQDDANFLMGLRSDDWLGQWYSNEAQINLAIRRRMGTPLPYFDGAVFESYQYPTRTAQAEFCNARPEAAICVEGHGFDPRKPFVPLSSFEVKLSTIENAGRGVYSTYDIEEGAYIFVDGCVRNIYIPDSTVRLIDDFAEEEYKNISLSQWETLSWYTYGYGFINDDYGTVAHDVDPGIGTFVNHGCNGTTNVGQVEYMNLTEFSVDFVEPDVYKMTYNPAMDRALRTASCATSVALRNLKKGEEVFNNYMTFENAAELEGYAESLRNECAGKVVGQVSEYELSAQGKQTLRPRKNASNDAASSDDDAEVCLQCANENRAEPVREVS